MRCQVIASKTGGRLRILHVVPALLRQGGGPSESGEGAAMLPRERLFAAGDWMGLAELIARDIRGELPTCSIGTWTAEAAADFLIKECQRGEK